MGGYGLRVAKKQNIPKLSTFHTLLSEYVEYISPLGIGQETLKKISWRYCFHHYNKYDQVITPSCAIRDMLKIKKPIAVIPTGIDVRLLKPESSKKSREKLGIRTEKMYLCLGRLSPEKNLDFVIDTSKYFLGDDSQLIIAGRGPVQRKLENQVADMGMEKKIKFVGYVSDADKVRYYSAADAFILASTSETQGIVVLEAMACGCPVIAADSLAIPEFVKNGKNGFLFRPGDGQQLAELVDNFNYTKRMAKEALKTAHSCSIEKCTDKLEKIYGLLVSDS
jgi:glycosyltransferase involved in cell wall biosynthesis